MDQIWEITLAPLRQPNKRYGHQGAITGLEFENPPSAAVDCTRIIVYD